jgi:hypothetical protein
MLKLELKSIYMLCRNCSPSQTEHNKIGFAIFWIFLRFYMDFTRCSWNTQKGEESFCKETPGKFWRLTYMPSVCAQAPGKKTNPAIGSTGMGRWRITGFRRGGTQAGRDRAERGEGLTRDRLPGLGWTGTTAGEELGSTMPWRLSVF